MIQVFNLQMTSVPDVEENLAKVRKYLSKHSQLMKNNIVVLPECFAFFGGKERDVLSIAEPLGKGKIQATLATLAKEFSIYLVGGSIPIIGNTDNKFKNVCIVYSPNGEPLVDYQKIHLFDVTVADGTGSYRESDTAEAGDQIVTFQAGDITVGVAICYDLRFPGLFQLLRAQAVDLMVLPSAFTQKTGEAHWHVLVQARAIENQCYFAACNQVGTHDNGRETYGHSIVVDPWGTIISEAKLAVGLYGSSIDSSLITKVRGQMPVHKHNRIECKLK